MCAEIKLRAERRAGELLKEQIPHEGGRPAGKQSHDATVSAPKLSDIGINKSQSSRWQKIADVAEENFDTDWYLWYIGRGCMARRGDVAVNTAAFHG